MIVEQNPQLKEMMSPCITSSSVIRHPTKSPILSPIIGENAATLKMCSQHPMVVVVETIRRPRRDKEKYLSLIYS